MFGFELFKRAPRDLIWLLMYHFLEAFMLFNLFSILMWVLTENCALQDHEAGFVYGAFGLAVSVFGLLMGPLIDKILVKNTLLTQIILSIGASVIMGIQLNTVTVSIALFLLFAPSLSMIHTGVSVGLMRYSTTKYRSLAFAAHYVVMNLGAVASSLVVDLFRLKLQPYEYTPVLLYRSIWSFFMLCCAVLHLPSLLFVMFGIRDIQVVEDDNEKNKWQTIPMTSDTQPRSLRQLWQKIKEIMKDAKFWRYVLVSTSLIGARSVFIYFFTLYPVYLKRAPYPVNNPQDVPFMTFLVIDPIIVIVLSWVMQVVVKKMHWESFWVIVVGTIVGAGAPFLMMITHYWAVILFIIVTAVAESIWSPLYLSYSTMFTTKAEEGIFFGLTGMTTTASKMVTSVLSGFLLQRFCPGVGSHLCGQGRWIWFITGCIAVATPVLLVAFMKWTWLKSNESSYDKLTNEDIELQEQTEEPFTENSIIEDIENAE